MKLPYINERYMELRPETRAKYVQETIRETLFMNNDGVSATNLVERLPFSRKVIEKYLEGLVLVNEAYKKEYGRTTIYFPNNRAIHPVGEVEKKLDEKVFRAVIIDNLLGKFVYIQEYEEGSYGEEIKGGLLIPLKTFSKFLSFTEDINKELVKRHGDNP